MHEGFEELEKAYQERMKQMKMLDEMEELTTVAKALKTFLITSWWAGCGCSDALVGPLGLSVVAVGENDNEITYEVYREDRTLYTTCTDVGAALYLIGAINSAEGENLTSGNN